MSSAPSMETVPERTRSRRSKTLSIVAQGFLCSGILFGLILWLWSIGLNFRRPPSETFAALTSERRKTITTQHASGRPFSEGTLSKGVRTGVWTFHHDCPGAPVERRTTYSAGILDGPFEAFSREGRLMAKGSYLQGEKDGKWEEYWPQNGYLRSRGSYDKGKMAGTWTFYRADRPGVTAEVVQK